MSCRNHSNHPDVTTFISKKVRKNYGKQILESQSVQSRFSGSLEKI